MAKNKNGGNKKDAAKVNTAADNKSVSVSAEAVEASGVKKLLKGDSFLEWFAVILLILILLMITVLAIGSPKRSVKKFAKALTKENGGKTYFSMVYPDEFIDNIKSEEYLNKHASVTSWEDELEKHNAAKKEELSNGKLKVEKIEKVSRLSTDGVNAASSYFKTKFTVNEYHCTKGYEYKITFDKEGSDSSLVYNVCVVKLKTDGWKIIEMDEERLIDEY